MRRSRLTVISNSVAIAGPTGADDPNPPWQGERETPRLLPLEGPLSATQEESRFAGLR